LAGQRLAQARLSGNLRALATARIGALVTAALGVLPDLSQAQGGPPLVTDDPDTPGNGRLEINLATIATHTTGRWSVAAPDADINFGCGDAVQLTAEIPWTLVTGSGAGWDAGLGSAQLGVKWRFLDHPDLGFTLSTFPKFTSAWVQASRRRGIADAGHEFLLPLEAATQLGGFGLDAELARNFAGDAPGQWQFGAIAEHACGGGKVECMLELRERLGGGDQQTLVNLGLHWKLSQSLALIGAAGHEFGRASADQQRALLYMGIQILR
jgi:hypothetical protein